MKQVRFTNAEYLDKMQVTRREKFLAEMPQLLLWDQLEAVIEPSNSKSGSAVDVTIIAAVSSTKKSSGECDPEMRQIKKGNHWHFEMKAPQRLLAKSMVVTY